jgi:hypothetical protein
VTEAGNGGGNLGAGAGGEIGEKKWEGKKRMSTARDLYCLVLRVMIQYPDMIPYPSLSSFIVCHVNIFAELDCMILVMIPAL